MRTEHLWKFLSLLMLGLEEHYKSYGLQEQSSSAYSMDEGGIPETPRIEQGVVLSCKPGLSLLACILPCLCSVEHCQHIVT